MSKNSTYNLEYDNSIKKLLEIEPWYFNFTPFKSEDYHFKCVSHSTIKANNVHSLQPNDITIIAALGDGFTTGLASNKPIDYEHRYLSWSIGGKRNPHLYYEVTLPNILKQIHGAISGVGSDYIKGYNDKSTRVVTSSEKRTIDFNAALAGATSNSLPGQASLLIEHLKSDRNIDYKNEWKLLTIFIGANDLCHCYSAQNFERKITETLDILYKEVPRMFVNLVNVMNIDEVIRHFK